MQSKILEIERFYLRQQLYFLVLVSSEGHCFWSQVKNIAVFTITFRVVHDLLHTHTREKFVTISNVLSFFSVFAATMTSNTPEYLDVQTFSGIHDEGEINRKKGQTRKITSKAIENDLVIMPLPRRL